MISKAKRKKRRSQDREANRKRRIVGYLRQWGLWGDIHNTPLEPLFLNARYRKLRLELTPDVAADARASAVLKEVNRLLHKMTFYCPGFAQRMRVQEYFSVVKPLLDLLRGFDQGIYRSCPEFIRTALDRNEHLLSPESIETAFDAIFQLTHVLLFRLGRLDERLYYLTRHEGADERGEYCVTFHLHVRQARSARIESEGEVRPAFQCGLPSGKTGIEWLEWDSSVLGTTAGEQRYPVFVQRHALRQLFGENGRLRVTEDFNGWLHLGLCFALSRPRLTPKPDQRDHFLIEYSLFGIKVGYFVAVHLPDKVLIKTFLFLTMDGTPEGKLLWEKLRLRRHDKQYLELDNLATFLMTDVFEDPEVARALNECGCGHLRRLRDPRKLDNLKSGYAEDVRKYLQGVQWLRN